MICNSIAIIVLAGIVACCSWGLGFVFTPLFEIHLADGL